MTTNQIMESFREHGVAFCVNAQLGGGVTVSARGEEVTEDTLHLALTKLHEHLGLGPTSPVDPMHCLKEWCLEHGLEILDRHAARREHAGGNTSSASGPDHTTMGLRPASSSGKPDPTGKPGT